jgi:hypothetical protein
VTKSQGVTVHWTGGDPTERQLLNRPADHVLQLLRSGLGQTFTVPSYITSSIPSGNGYSTLIQGTQPVLFSATGLDYSYAYVSEMTQTSVAFQ